jgi:pyruvate formate lyase activating enzyme
LRQIDLVLLDIKSGDPDTYRRVTGVELHPTLRFAERLAAMGKPVWVRFVLVPGLTDGPENIGKVARFVAPMPNVEWVEVLPFHQMGGFKWKALGLDYRLEEAPTPTDAQVAAALGIFRDAGCRAR